MDLSNGVVPAPQDPSSPEPSTAGEQAVSGTNACEVSRTAAAVEAVPEESGQAQHRGRWRRAIVWMGRVSRQLAPGPHAWKGAAWGILTATAVIFFTTAWSLFDVPNPNLLVLIPVVALILLAALVGGAFVLLVALLRRLPVFYRWVLGGCAVLLSMLVTTSPAAGALHIAGIAGAASLLGAGVATFGSGAYRCSTRGQRIVAAGGGLLGLLVTITATTLLLWEGAEAKPIVNAAQEGEAKSSVPKLTPSDPSQRGAYPVKTLFYGNGSDRRRPEYGSGVAIRTKSVDGSELLERWKGAAGWARTKYWGFDAKQLPVQGRVWYPDGPGPFPLVLIVHGNHLMEEPSDPGYEYLGELMASRGYIFASVDENFLNSSPADLLGVPDSGWRDENDGRGWMLLEHLRAWREWNGADGNPFRGKVDLNRIGLIGHSRGGEAVAVAAAFNRLPYYPDNARVRFDYNFNIRGVVAIAPVDGQYKPAGIGTPLENVNYFVLHGAHDADMASFHGSRVYQRVKFTGDDYWFKAALYIHLANHGQFNRSWGRSDTRGIWTRFLNLRQLMPAADQERIARVYISAFLDAALRGERGYVPLFRDHRAAPGWLPAGVYLNQLAESTSHPVSDFQEDLNLATTSLPGGSVAGENLADWKEKEVPIKWGTMETRAVYLGWNRREWKETAAYTLSLPPTGLAVDPGSELIFSLADSGQQPSPKDKDAKKDDKAKDDGADTKGKDGKKDPIDLSVELVDRAGQAARVPLSSFSFLQPQIEAQFTKARYLTKTPVSEIVFQSFAFPLQAFVAVNGKLDPARLAAIRFVFDRTESGVVVLDDVAFRPPRQAVGSRH